MNEHLPSPLVHRSTEVVQARIALRIGAALSEYLARNASPDIDERLRFARERALASAREARAAAGPVQIAAGQAGGAVLLASGPDGTPWWLRLGSLLPLAVLLAGLVLIDSHYTRSQIEAAAEVDAAILADDLPPEAYRDQGFVEFLKTAQP